MSLQILTATEVLDSVELERLRLHTFRAPELDGLVLEPSILDFIEFDASEIEDILDVEKSSYYKDGEFTYVIHQYRNIDNLISSVIRHNDVEKEVKLSTGLIESDTTNLTMTFVFPTKYILEVQHMFLGMYIKATKAAFYI